MTVAQDTMHGGDRGSDHGGGVGMGVGAGVGLGIGIIQGIVSQPGGRPDDEHSTKGQKPKNQAKADRAGKKDDKPPSTTTTNNPPPTTTTNNPPPTTTTNNPPPTTTEAPPPASPGSPPSVTVENPPTNTPGPLQPVAPPDQPATKNNEDCPQRGKGCAALIIDFSAHFDETDHLKKMRDALENIDCDVQYVDPEFRNANASQFSEQRAAVREWNDKQMKWMREEISKHRKKLEEGRELAIEMITGHGGAWEFDDDGSSTFGVFGPHQLFHNNFAITERADSDKKQKLGEGRSGLTRGLFHSGNYTAANKHVCAWFVFDHSCYSGLTPRAIDTLNNTGKAEYTYKPIDQCGLHAAYEEDLGVGTSKSDAQCNASDAPTATAPLIKELESFEKSIQGDSPADFRSLIAKLSKVFWTSEGFYHDGGHHYCTGPIRSGYNFEASPKPDDAPKGPYYNTPTLLPPDGSEPISK